MIENKEKALEAFAKFLDAVFENTAEEIVTNEKQSSTIDKLLTFKEVCNYFHLSPTTLERRIREGLKYSQAVRNGNRLFRLSDCKEFFNINNN